MGEDVAPYAAYFEICRRKRNQVDYDMADVATEFEAQDLLGKAEEFREVVTGWIQKNHPRLRF